MYGRMLASALGAAVLWSAAAAAADEEKLLELFFGSCVNNTPAYLEKLTAAAEIMGWKPLEGAAATMMAPADPNSKYLGWVANFKDTVFMVGASEGIVDGKAIKTCAITARHAMPEPTAKLLGEQLILAPVADQKEAGQRYQLWKSEVAATPIMIMLTSVTDGQAAVTLSVLLQEN